ncbi:MAG: hypothetical protein HYY17_16300 [Planctomycetes bacterium]|nr:hypothetical protein [Planctomycetota bacterium]
MLAAAFALWMQTQSAPPEFAREDLGIAVRRLPEGYRLRKPDEDSDVVFEISDEAGKATGSAVHLAGWPRARGRADAWEGAVRKDRATRSLRLVKEEVLAPALGEALRREWVLETAEGSRCILGLFVSRGDRTLRLLLQAPQDAWDRVRDPLVRLTDAVEMHHVWRCAACGAAAMGGTASCPQCAASLYPRDDRIRDFSRKFEIQIVLDPSRSLPIGDVSGEAPARRDAEAFCPMLAREVKKYPDDFFRRVDVGRILLLRDIRFKNPPPGKVLAFAMYHPRFAMVIDVTEKQKFATIHHEFFHFLDFVPDYSTKDGDWVALNEKGFRYDSTLWAESLAESKVKGFISQYARAGEAEDKAELFACLMMDQKRARVRAQGDAVLARKLARLKEIVREFCPKMDDEHWRSLDR